MSPIDEVLELRNELVKCMEDLPLDNTPVLAILKRLQGYTIDHEVLKKTGVGKHVNMVRKKDGANEEVKKLAKTLAKEYKTTAEKGGRRSSIVSSEKSVELPTTTNISDVAQKYITGDKIRDNMRRMLCSHGLCVKDKSNEAALRAAADVESAIFQRHGMGDAYKKAIKTRTFNLTGNAELRNLLLAGKLTGEYIASMSTEDMRSSDVKAYLEKVKEDFARDKQMAFKEGARTTEFKCPKCKKRDCSYTQAQTRSADEPMTTFCGCNICGHRWKFC